MNRIYKKVVKKIKKIKDLYKTLYVNFKFLPFQQAIKLPIAVSKNVIINKKSKGKILLQDVSSKIYIGYQCLNTSYSGNEKSILCIDGNLIIKGNAFLAHGIKLDIREGGMLILGNGFNSTGKSEIICMKKIEFGDDCTVSWDTLFMDSDAHTIMYENQVINKNQDIKIGNHCWIGCRSIILKGVYLEQNTIVAAGSIISKSCEEKNSIISSNGNIIKHNVCWNLKEPY